MIVDTAGRLQIDAELMDELREIRDAVQPHDTLLVVDAMTGQEAVNVAEAFDEAVGLDGVVLTKIDGDARGGAALSVKEVVGKPILFAGTGEKLEDFEPFHPDRMASRILGMGDVLTLIEKAEAAFDEERGGEGRGEAAQGPASRSRTSSTRCARSRRWARCRTSSGCCRACPRSCKNAEIDEGELGRVEAIICSMTPARAPRARRSSTARAGSASPRAAGSRPSDVNGLLKQFKKVQQMMRGVAPRARCRKGKKGKRAKLPISELCPADLA